MKEQKQPFTLRGKYFFLAVVCIYLIMFVWDFSSARVALYNGLHSLVKIVPIFVVVIVCTAAINAALRPRQIVKHLGRESGYKGWCLALLAGVISHGPMYAWYPMIEELRRHGMRDRLIVTFFYSRAIKLPLLPLMVDYFGLLFTCILSFYILIGALLQGACFSVLAGNASRE